MLSALPRPEIIEPDSVPALRWGVVGIGGIVRAFTRALHLHTNQRVDSVAGRDAERAEAFATAHGIQRSAGSVDNLVADPSIDVVCVGTPHTAHKEIALHAIAAGKHVLVEKPFAMSSAEGSEITAAARAAGVFVMEAMWTRYLPQSSIIRQLLADGAIGAVNLVIADFGFVAPYDPTSRMWNPELGGGALLDAGVYPLSFASSVVGAPVKITAAGALTDTGVDARAAVHLATASGANALIATSMVAPLPVRATIAGTAGRIDIASSFLAPSGITVFQTEAGSDSTLSWEDTRFENPHDGLSYQAVALASYTAQGRTESPLHDLDETVSVLATIDEARRQVAAAAHG
jgi:predicted dehydrogenase